MASFLGLKLLAQEQLPDQARITFNLERIDEDKHLLTNQVLAVYQDRSGYLWLGSYSGLSRWDGHNSKNYSTKDGLLTNRLATIGEDDQGRIWLGFRDGGIQILDGDQFLPPHESGYFEELHWAGRIVNGEDGEMLVGTAGGLLVFKDGDVRHYQMSADHAGVNDIVKDPSRDGYWLASLNMLGYFENGNITLVENLPETATLRTLIFDPAGRLLVGGDRGVLVYDGKTFTPLTVNGEPVTDTATKAVGNGDTIWFALSQGRILIYNRRFATYLSESEGLSATNITALALDREGSLWIAQDDAFFRHTPSPFGNITTSQGLPHNFVRALFTADGETIWIGTRQGIAYYHPRSGLTPFDASPLQQPSVYGISAGPGNSLLFATDKGLLMVDGDQRRVFTPSNGLRSEGIQETYTDSSGTIWAANVNLGYKRADQTDFQSLPKGHPLYETSITDIKEDQEGYLWIGSARGIFRMNGETLQVTSFPEITVETIWCLNIDARNRVYAASNGDGVFIIDGDQVTNLTTADGLDNDFCWQVLATNNGALWVNHSFGFNRIVQGRTELFSKRDGLPANEGTATAILEDGSGKVWFGTSSGLIIYDPEIKVPQGRPPHVRITQVRNRDGQVLPGNTWERDWNNLTISYDAISFLGENTYEYRLHPIDPDWSRPTQELEVNYLNLAPGTYQFQVRAHNSRGGMSRDHATFDFRIKPAFYETTFARILSLLLLMIFVFGYVRLRTRRMARQQGLLKQLVDERTKALVATQQKLVESAHRAGMAEVAVDILHNLGNTLNSVEVAVYRLHQGLEDQRDYRIMERLLELLEKVGSRYQMGGDQEADRVPRAVRGLLEYQHNKRRSLMDELKIIQTQLDLIKHIVDTQKDFAENVDFRENTDLVQFIEEIIADHAPRFREHQVQVETTMEPLPEQNIPRYKLSQILNHLIRNALEAMDNVENRPRRLEISCKQSHEHYAAVVVRDNGPGIPEQDHLRIFNLGYSQKNHRPGYGLHLSANLCREMGGALRLLPSDQGATFEVTIPLNQAED